MNDPKRLIEDFAPGFERDVLLSGARERAPLQVRERVEARALDAVAGVAAASSLAAAASTTAAGKSVSALGMVVIQWLAVGAVAGGVTALAGSELAGRAAPAPRPATAAAAAGPKSAPKAVARAVAPPRPKREPAPATHPVRGHAAQGQVRIGASSTLVEATAIRRIRLEAKRDPGRALTLVDRYLARFPDGAHAGEAKALERELIRKLDSSP